MRLGLKVASPPMLDEPAIMASNDEGVVPLTQNYLKLFDSSQVKIVCWLANQENLRVLCDCHRKLGSPLIFIRELTDGCDPH